MDARKKQRLLLVAAVCLSSCCGCIHGNVLSYTRYDQANDSFACLEIYANIATKDEDELNHIARLWSRKDNLIINAIPEIRIFGSPTIFERRGPHGYLKLPIAQAMEKEPEAVTTSVDLDTIRVTPGEFFLNEYRNLCCSHKAVIPGATVDAAMRELMPLIADGLAQLGESQIQLAGKEGSKPTTWNDVRDSMLVSLGEKEAKPAEDEKKGEKLLPLEKASLRLLIKAGADGSVRFTRKADAFTLVVPLSKRDCDEAVATVDLVREVVAERLKAGKQVEKDVTDVLDACEIQHLANTGLSVTVHVGKLAERKAREPISMPEPDADSKLLYRTTAASIQGRGIEINKTDLFPTIVKDFLGTATAP
jgi:hypothetical protein